MLTLKCILLAAAGFIVGALVAASAMSAPAPKSLSMVAEIGLNCPAGDMRLRTQ
jgi:hypothetical protein